MNDLTATLSPAEWDYIAKCLDQRPHGEVRGLIDKLALQLNGPQKAPEPPADPAPTA